MDYRTIYAEHPEEYDRLVRAEDCEGHLPAALRAVCPLRGKVAVDVGTGTGRVAELLLREGAHVVGVEPSPAMLRVARRRMESAGGGRWELHEGRAEALPVATASADFAVAGWVLGHFRAWFPDSWEREVGRALAELERVVVPGGTIAIVETMGTGNTEPAPPSAELGEYFAWLEGRGYARTTFRTDYLFPDVATAASVCGFFFGHAMADRIVKEGWARVPECTGLFHRVRP